MFRCDDELALELPDVGGSGPRAPPAPPSGDAIHSPSPVAVVRTLGGPSSSPPAPQRVPSASTALQSPTLAA